MTKFKFNLKRLASLMIIFVIAFAMLPTGALAAEENGNCTGTHTGTALDSTTLASLIVTDAKGNESYTLSAGSYYLTEDITTAMTVTISENEEVTLCLNGHALKYNNSETKASVITVKGDATLNLCDCNGSNGSHTITSPVTNESVTITGGLITGGTGNTAPATVETVTYGGGIYVEGTLNMYGGNISGNIPRGSETLEGGGIYITGASQIEKAGTFNLYGGSVSHNKAIGGGGGVRIGGTMNMYGGNISDNIAYSGGGIVNYGTLNISGGDVKNNKTNNSTQGLGSGGGVLNYGDMTLSGTGEISGNSADGNDYAPGGGVYNKDSSRNSGICRFTMTGGKITDNQANGAGGGVVTEFTGQSPTLFVMTGGEITGNQARVSGGVDNSGKMQLSGGSITGNTATKEGGGLRNTGTLTVSGNPVITGNTNGNLYVRWHDYYQKFCVATIGADGLTDGANIGVTTGKAPTADSPIAITTGTNAKDYSRYFTSDDDAYIVYSDADHGNTLMLGVKHLVTNDGKDAEITYDGSTYDVSTMFTRDANAGKPSYSIIGGTGAGKLDGSTLTITKGGTIMIKMTTAQNKTYVADEVTATLTVHNGPEPGNEGTEGGTSSNPKPTVSNVPVTGNNSNVLLWIALMVSAGTGLLGITIYSKKRKAER